MDYEKIPKEVWDLRSARCRNGSHMSCKSKWCMCACHHINQERIQSAIEHLEKKKEKYK